MGEVFSFSFFSFKTVWWEAAFLPVFADCRFLRFKAFFIRSC